MYVQGKWFRGCIAVLLLIVLVLPQPARAYSVLSHEEVVDMVWKDHIVPLLQARFPGLDDDSLRIAHAYAYGGCVIQDIGYYPFGSHFFSDLLHYVRTGDFVTALLRDASDANEYAFALGAMAHYASDLHGHPYINEVTAEEYPKLRTRFGRMVTYEDDSTAHLRTEFGFDVVEVAHGRYAQEQYRDFIGFQVAKPLLERAFQETYGFDVKDIMPHEDLAIGSYRRSVSKLIPQMTHVALVRYGKEIKQETPNFDRRKFLYRLNKTDYEKQWDHEYQEPGKGARFVAFLLKAVPDSGPFRALHLRMPNAKEQDLYLKSVNSTVDAYTQMLEQMKSPAAQLHGLTLDDRDFDTGEGTKEGEYRLADTAHIQLLQKLVAKPGVAISPALRANLLDYFNSPDEPKTLQAKFEGWKPEDWQTVQSNLTLLRNATLMPPDLTPTPIPEGTVPAPKATSPSAE